MLPRLASPVSRPAPVEEWPMIDPDPSVAWPGNHDYTARVALAEHIASANLDDDPSDGVIQDW